MVQRRQIHVGSVKKCMNKSVDALILKTVVNNLQIAFPSQQERRSSSEGTKGIRRLWGTGIPRADPNKNKTKQKVGRRRAKFWCWRTIAWRRKRKERHRYLRWKLGHVSQSVVPGPASGSLGNLEIWILRPHLKTTPWETLRVELDNLTNPLVILVPTGGWGPLVVRSSTSRGCQCVSTQWSGCSWLG